MALETTPDLSPNLVIKLQERAEQEARTWQELATEILEESTQESNQAPDRVMTEEELIARAHSDPQLLALVAAIRDTPPNLNAIIPSNGSLKEALEESLRLHPTDYSRDWVAWQREWEAIWAEVDRFNNEDGYFEERP